MAIVTFNKDSFAAALEPGLSVLIVQAFQDKLEEKLNGIVQDVYAELEKELPSRIESKIRRVMEVHSNTERVQINVDLRS